MKSSDLPKPRVLTVESLRTVLNRMATSGVTESPVVDRHDPSHVLGTLDLHALLKVRARHLKEEHHRERVFSVHKLMPESWRSFIG